MHVQVAPLGKDLSLAGCWRGSLVKKCQSLCHLFRGVLAGPEVDRNLIPLLWICHASKVELRPSWVLLQQLNEISSIAPRSIGMMTTDGDGARTTRLSLVKRNVVEIELPFTHLRLDVADGVAALTMQERESSTSNLHVLHPTARKPGNQSQTTMMLALPMAPR